MPPWRLWSLKVAPIIPSSVGVQLPWRSVGNGLLPAPTALSLTEQRRGGATPPELIGRVAPTRTEGINLRGVFRFLVERYAHQIPPSAAAEKTMAGTA